MPIITKKISTGGAGGSASQHRSYDQLVHNIAEDAYTEYTYSGSRITNEVIWTNNSKTMKIRESIYTYSGNKLTQAIINQYNSEGSIIETLTEMYYYTGNNINYIDLVLT